jgi:Derlin-2/3
MDPNVNLLDWYWDMPLITRLYFTASLGVTVLCALDVVSPYHLYFNARQIARGEFWRLGTNFLFFGQFGLDFIFHMYFLIRYCRSLEESSFRGRPADFFT